MKFKLILSLILVCLVILFIIQNVAIVDIHFFAWTLAMSGALIFFLFFALGAVFGWLLQSYLLHRKKQLQTKT